LIGYSFQGMAKFGLYEYFKHLYSDAFPNVPKDLAYVAGSASAEIIADVLLCPWEAVKVRMQTADPSKVPRGFPTTMREGLPLIIKNEGFSGLYKGLVPLWSRQIPYTIMKFWAFERTVQALYMHVVPKPREQCSKPEQTAVSFAAGYIAGIFCAVVSHPADVVVSKLNQYSDRPPLGKVLGELGMRGIWRGLGMRVVMVGTLTGLQWFIYDSFKAFVGLPTTGSAEKK
jgi:solute carrier family 25 (mitochondrial phosphate transporter), member 3